MAHTKTNKQNNTKHVEHQDATYIKKKETFLFVIIISKMTSEIHKKRP